MVTEQWKKPAVIPESGSHFSIINGNKWDIIYCLV